MRYLSVCSGIEAATVAWHDMGWEAAAYSEIEKFPSEVLKYHYPSVPNMGDMTKFKEWDFGTNRLDLLVGGTPCQSFSVAGLRKGLEDPRGNLTLTYVGILDKFRPKWFIWENVPGVLSSNKGKDFGSFLGALAELGYGFSYRVLDAQYFGVAQRRRRVFVVGHLGDWRPTAQVLFESESLCRDSKASRKPWQEVAATITARFGASRNNYEEIAPALTCGFGKSSGQDLQPGLIIPAYVADKSSALMARDFKGIDSDGLDTKAIVEYCSDVSATLTSSGAGFSRPGQTSTAHENYIAIQGNLIGRDKGGPQGVGVAENSLMYTLTKGDVHGVAHAFKIRGGCEGGGKGYLGQDEKAFTISTMQDQQIAVLGGLHPNAAVGEEISPTLTSAMGMGGGHVPVIANMAVRRLTPVECERLQGFPDNYTNIKENCPDGPRYKALGNSMAVPVMKWIGKRIQMVEDGLI
jgi:DNA (cytosine-5)-methyltransferase 1